MQVASVVQTWLGRRTLSVRTRLGAMGPLCRLSVVMGRLLRALSGKDTLYAHESSDAVAPSWTAQHLSQARAAIGFATTRELLTDAFAQAGVLQLAWSRATTTLNPIVIASARDQKRLA